MTHIRIIPFIILSFALSGCFQAKAVTKEPDATVVVVDSEIEIIDSNTVNQ
mgnify:FL=1